ncbi:hypothetical protein Lacal_2875 [Lacinutrix sp. 5H-3-7-4]|nr:hypothetical protein Lacal_2875 [Lacinutrix sp. 5H-3-7-4]
MPYFEMKTHKIGKTYSNPHFFILNKGLNSGKPLSNPCPNCFVVITKTETDKNTLFHLSMMLQIGGFYAYYLRGSVIPFISVDDCRNTLKKGLKTTLNQNDQMQKHIKAVEVISKKEKELQNVIDKMAVLKVAYIRNCFKLMQTNEA